MKTSAPHSIAEFNVTEAFPDHERGQQDDINVRALHEAARALWIEARKESGSPVRDDEHGEFDRKLMCYLCWYGEVFKRLTDDPSADIPNKDGRWPGLDIDADGKDLIAGAILAGQCALGRFDFGRDDISEQQRAYMRAGLAFDRSKFFRRLHTQHERIESLESMMADVGDALGIKPNDNPVESILALKAMRALLADDFERLVTSMREALKLDPGADLIESAKYIRDKFDRARRDQEAFSEAQKSLHDKYEQAQIERDDAYNAVRKVTGKDDISSAWLRFGKIVGEHVKFEHQLADIAEILDTFPGENLPSKVEQLQDTAAALDQENHKLREQIKVLESKLQGAEKRSEILTRALEQANARS